MENYAIEVLQDELSNEQTKLLNRPSLEMKKVYENNIEDLEIALHNLKKLESINDLKL